LAFTRYCYYQYCMVYDICTGGQRGSRILPNSRATVLHHGEQCRWARGRQGWLNRAQITQRKSIYCNNGHIWPLQEIRFVSSLCTRIHTPVVWARNRRSTCVAPSPVRARRARCASSKGFALIWYRVSVCFLLGSCGPLCGSFLRPPVAHFPRPSVWVVSVASCGPLSVPVSCDIHSLSVVRRLCCGALAHRALTWYFLCLSSLRTHFKPWKAVGTRGEGGSLAAR